MSDQMNAAITDEMLVAYLDHQLAENEVATLERALASSGDLQQRLAKLEAGFRPFTKAFGILLNQQPPALQHKVEQMVAAHHSGQAAAFGIRWPDRRLVVATGAMGFLAASLGYWAGRSSTPDMSNWREAVAQYHKLYSDQTLESVSDSASVADDALGRTARALGLPLPRAAFEVSGLTYKRAQVLQIDKTPLAQVSFVTQRGKPLALCIRRMDGATSPPQLESRAGLSVVHWLQGGFGFMVLADINDVELQHLAATFSENLSGVAAKTSS